MPTTVNSAPIGVEGLVFATLTDETLGTYGTVTPVSPLINIKITPKSNADVLYANNRQVERVVALGDIDVEFETQSLPLEVQAIMLGHTLDPITGVMVYNVNDIAPYIAIGFKIKKGNGKYKYVWLLKGSFEELSEEYATQEDKSKFATPKLKGGFMSRNDGLWKYSADEDAGTTPVSDTFLATVFASV